MSSTSSFAEVALVVESGSRAGVRLEEGAPTRVVLEGEPYVLVARALGVRGVIEEVQWEECAVPLDLVPVRATGCG
jgi:hypothetical protein